MAKLNRKKKRKVLNNLNKLISEARSTELEVGWFSSAKYPEDSMPVATVAAKNELGVGVPKRPFMRPAIAENEDMWRSFIKRSYKKVVKGSVEVSDVFEALGLSVQGSISKAIMDVVAPPLAEETIRQRVMKMKNKTKVGSLDKPLVETGHMIKSVTYKVTS